MRTIRSIAIIASLVVLAGCQTTQPAVFCEVAQPITYSAQNDTPETVAQVQEFNAVWTELCG